VQRHLNEVFSGGIGSYSLVCMIVSFLKVSSISNEKASSENPIGPY
jgi:DNA polymerase sigma